MTKKSYYLCIILFTLILFGCSKETEVGPNEAIDTYVRAWENEQFDDMYRFFTEATTKHYEKNRFVERYEKIFTDLQIKNLTITYDSLTKESIDEAIENEAVQVPIEVTMDSIAGAIEFSHTLKASLIPIEEDEKEWQFDWDDTYIFPELEDDESTIRVEVVTPRRGDILDRNRMPLAINDGAYEVGIVPQSFENKDSEINRIAAILDISEASINQKLNASWVQEHHFVPIRKISNMDEEKINQLQYIPSVILKNSTGRHYPMGEMTAHLIGYISKVTAEDLEKEENKSLSEEDFVGKSGLEQIFEQELRGKKGIKIIVTNEFGIESIVAEKPVEHGQSITLTIDVNVQKSMFEVFEEHTGAGVALHPKTGELLGLVSYPAYNPNDFVFGISESKWNSLSNNEDLPLFNRYTATFAPGSVLKPITAAIGLTDGSLTKDETLEINGLTWKKDNWKDAKITRVSTSNKPVDLKDALGRSDNIFFAQKALDIGGNSLVKGFKAFGFDETIPINFPVKKSSISNSGTLQDEALLANTSYGQGEIEVSPLHIALMYTSFLNEGNMIKPKLLQSDKNGQVWKENILSTENANLLNDYLRYIVTDGTAKFADDDDVTIAGKTGTVELKLSYDSEGDKNNWFIGYENKKENILVALLFEDTGENGSKNVTEAVKDIIKEYEK